MKMFMVLAVLALAAAASAQKIGWEWPQQGAYGAAAALYPCAEYLRQPQCSPVAAPYYVRRGQTMWQPTAVCQPLRHHCCHQLGLMDAMSRCQAMCGVAQSVVPQLQLQGAAGGGMYEPPAALTMQQWRQLLPPAEAPMAVAQAAQDLPAMCGLYPLPSYCTIPCALSVAAPPYYY
ncbi:zein-beta-like [Panicum miliaceum]|uniref:Zein-beta-like n=1 Tax=Panicum miliaceum TaxID=4540 RepID=A0A3L6R645_PANMI|nr:zein-beta-like [Panicum miliaceum]